MVPLFELWDFPQPFQTVHGITQARIQDFGQGPSEVLTPRMGALSPKFVQNRGFLLKLPENGMVFKKKWGQGGSAVLIPIMPSCSSHSNHAILGKDSSHSSTPGSCVSSALLTPVFFHLFDFIWFYSFPECLYSPQFEFPHVDMCNLKFPHVDMCI